VGKYSGDSWQLGGLDDRAPIHPKRRGFKLRWVLVPLLCIISVLAVFSLRFFSSEAFPKLSPGLYGGTFLGDQVFGSQSEWLLNIADEYKHIEAVFLGSESAVYSVQRDSSGYLIVNAAERKIVLKGADKSGEYYQGDFEVPGSNKSGEWKLRPITVDKVEVDSSFHQWMLLRAEISRAERDIEIAKKLIPVQKAEIEDLTHMITDEGAMRERANSRLIELQEKRKNLSQALAAKKSEVINAETQLTLAQKISARGKLTNLARELNEREARWARSLLVGTSQEIDLEGTYERAQTLKTLKDAVAIERQLVSQLEVQE
jgi:hypothetical protein